MSVRLLDREMGAVLTCNVGDCDARCQTAQVQKKLIRTYAKTLGWIRGGSTTDGGRGKRADICPNHAPTEAERIAKFLADKEAKKRARDEAKKKKFAPLAGEAAAPAPAVPA